MAVEIRVPTPEQWAEVCLVDTRAFGNSLTPEEIEERRDLHDLSRFRIAVDGTRVVAVAASYAMDATLPGGVSVPMGGVTWVSVAATHRRQGLMRRVVGAVHDDIAERGEPIATLYASEGGIYENIDYGCSTQVRVASLNPRLTSFRREYSTAGGVCYLDSTEDPVALTTAMWERFRRLRAGETSRSAALHNFLADQRAKPAGPMSPVEYFVHADGYAAYRMEQDWNTGHPAHTMHIVEVAAITPEAHAALWETLLGVDLVGEIKSNALAIDDPLPYLLTNPRTLRTNELNDGVWVNVLDIPMAFAARSYRSTDRLVVEVDEKRWAIDGGPDGATCKPVRTRPDLTCTHAALSALLYGGVAPSALVAGRRMTARNDDVLRRADIFFTTATAPHCQTHY